MSTNKNKVAIISTSLASGGAERLSALLTFMLDQSGFEVHSIIVNDIIDYSYTGKLFNLGTECSSSYSFFKKLKKGILLKRYLRENNIKIIVDNRTRGVLIRELFVKHIYSDAKRYYIVQNCNFEKYFPPSIFWTLILYKKAKKLIAVSKEIEQNINNQFGLQNTTTIYNTFFIDKDVINQNINPEKNILFFGRFDEKAKNFTLMLDAFYHSKVYNKGYQLHLMVAGEDLLYIEEKIKFLKLETFVQILPFKSSPFDEVKKAKFTILTSHYEGFPLSIIESLAVGTPVIAVDCHSGPREVIQNEFNGLLVEKDNVIAFAVAMNRFVDDDKLYTFCKKNAAASVEHLSLEMISQKWKILLQ